MAWSVSELPDQSGRTIVVTGANSGIGYEAARAFAGRGARVVLACRSPERGAAAAARLKEGLADADLWVRSLDLANLSSVRAFAHDLSAELDSLDVLVNNAGVMAIPRRQTADGFEMQLGTNHLGHFLLSSLLVPLMAGRSDARVVTITSYWHHVGRIAWNDLQSEASYHRWGAYAQSKFANVVFTQELARRAEAAGMDLKAVNCHPGYASTNLQYVGLEMAGRGTALTQIVRGMNATLAQSAERGAWPTVLSAIGPADNGGLYGPWSPFELWGRPRVGRISWRARNAETMTRLWQVSAELTGAEWPRLPGDNL